MNILEALPNFSPARVGRLEDLLLKATDRRPESQRLSRLMTGLENLPLHRLTVEERRSLTNLLARGLGYRSAVPHDPVSLRALILELREALAEAGVLTDAESQRQVEQRIVEPPAVTELRP